uniref:Helicase superfamily 3 single-stranded DNA/RNA virus domain-containing protein n=1 Tax=Dermatophagoides pteronyssinus virus 6 TaxID=2851133 RepID=A0A8F3E1W6_9VIRU|nr:hypothetical protein DerpV6_gp1 [Dermatophagoides pteronyssinus virus 6]
MDRNGIYSRLCLEKNVSYCKLLHHYILTKDVDLMDVNKILKTITYTVENSKCRILLLKFLETFIFETYSQRHEKLLSGFMDDKTKTSVVLIKESAIKINLLCLSFNHSTQNISKLTDIIQVEDDKIQNFSKIFFMIKKLNQKDTLNKFENFVFNVYVNYLKGAVFEMFLYTKNSSESTIGRVNIYYDYLVFVKNYLGTIKIEQKPIKIVELLGKPGLGKSSAVCMLANILNLIAPLIPYQDLVYTRTRDFFWNGYVGQPIVLYDDVCHWNRTRVDPLSELIEIGSGTLTNPPMAFLKEVKFTSLACFVTGNFPIMTKCRNSETSLALKRRIISGECTPFSECAQLVDGIYNYAFKGTLYSSILHENSFIFSYLNSFSDNKRKRTISDEIFSFNDETQEENVHINDSQDSVNNLLQKYKYDDSPFSGEIGINNFKEQFIKRFENETSLNVKLLIAKLDCEITSKVCQTDDDSRTNQSDLVSTMVLFRFLSSQSF